jgi:acetoin utilization deacetylase AcuC-like enzyme
VGFCLLPHAALVARLLLALTERLGGAVLVVDIDLHVGNGTRVSLGELVQQFPDLASRALMLDLFA